MAANNRAGVKKVQVLDQYGQFKQMMVLRVNLLVQPRIACLQNTFEDKSCARVFPTYPGKFRSDHIGELATPKTVTGKVVHPATNNNHFPVFELGFKLKYVNQLFAIFFDATVALYPIENMLRCFGQD